MRTYDKFLEAIRQFAIEGKRSDLDVVDDYDYDSSKWSAGPQKAIAIISIVSRLTVKFRIPVEELPEGYVFTFGHGELMCGWDGGDDPTPVLLEALGGQDKLFEAIMWEELDKYSFRTTSGIKSLTQEYGPEDITVKIPVKHDDRDMGDDLVMTVTGLQIAVSMTIRMSAHEQH